MPRKPDADSALHCGCSHDSHTGHADHEHACDSNAHAPVRPPSVYVYSPSGAVSDRPALRRGVSRLQKHGFQVTVDAQALARNTRFAGSHEERAAAVARAAASGADIALISRGGYGLNHLLPMLDYSALAHAVDHGTRFMGFSDFTALQMALFARTGRVSWAGASLGIDFGAADEPDEITMACFEDVLYGISEGAGWRIAKDSASHQGLRIEHAPLWGGNLAVLNSLLATPYFPSIEGGILFLEDVNEAPYKIERMLIQLEQAGVLARQQAILLGQFTNSNPVREDRGFNLKNVIEALRSRISVPVLTRLPFGHVATKVCLPFGAPVSLEVLQREAVLYWGHLGHQ